MEHPERKTLADKEMFDGEALQVRRVRGFVGV